MNEIKTENVSFSYDQKTIVLKDINLTLANKPTAIIGQNGAGKSTLVKLFKGLLKPTEGDIWINGKNTKEFTAAQLASHIGLVFQNPGDQIIKHKVIAKKPIKIASRPWKKSTWKSIRMKILTI